MLKTTDAVIVSNSNAKWRTGQAKAQAKQDRDSALQTLAQKTVELEGASNTRNTFEDKDIQDLSTVQSALEVTNLEQASKIAEKIGSILQQARHINKSSAEEDISHFTSDTPYIPTSSSTRPRQNIGNLDSSAVSRTIDTLSNLSPKRSWWRSLLGGIAAGIVGLVSYPIGFAVTAGAAVVWGASFLLNCALRLASVLTLFDFVKPLYAIPAKGALLASDAVSWLSLPLIGILTLPEATWHAIAGGESGQPAVQVAAKILVGTLGLNSYIAEWWK